MPGAFYPFSADSGLVAVWNGPIACKASEMIDPDKIEDLQLVFNAAYPPCVACLFMLFPVV
jgi:hypothetical protein